MSHKENEKLSSNISEELSQDVSRKKKKQARAVLSFVIMSVLLVGLFFAAVNIGSLKVNFPELLRGLFVERIDNRRFQNEGLGLFTKLQFGFVVLLQV